MRQFNAVVLCAASPSGARVRSRPAREGGCDHTHRDRIPSPAARHTDHAESACGRRYEGNQELSSFAKMIGWPRNDRYLGASSTAMHSDCVR